MLLAILTLLLTPHSAAGHRPYGAASSQPTEQDGAQEVAALEQHLARLEGLGFSGAVLVARAADPLLARGYGFSHRETQTRCGPDTVFPLGSISKHFTAAAVLRLEMEGALSTDDALGSFFEDVPEDKQGITIHHLLSHTSGLPGFLGGLQGAVDGEDFAGRVFQGELLFPPGQDSVYSNAGYGLLSVIVERVSGVDFGDFLREVLFEPAGMSRTGFSVASWKPGELAHGYIDGRDTGTLLESHGGRIPVELRGAGGLQSTATDMLRWSRAVRAGSVLDEASFAKMTTPHTSLGPDFAMGYGCGIQSSPPGKRIGHSGSNDVFSAHFQHYLEQDLFVFVAANDADFYADGVLRGVNSILVGQDPPPPPATIRLADADLARYAGPWTLGSDDGTGPVERIDVTARRGSLSLSSGSPLGAALLHPVRPRQVDRRVQLIDAVAASFHRAYAGDYEPLHELLDPYAPLEDFVRNEGQMLDGMVQRLGSFQEVRAIPGRNRFGEIAVIAALRFESDERRIEYSFGQDEVGSIRFIDEFPQRVVHPASRTAFVAYDAEQGTSWQVGFELDESELPILLWLTNEAGEAYGFSR